MIETEKKYKLNKENFEIIKKFLKKRYFTWTDKEENILYNGNQLSTDTVLRLRKWQRVEGKTWLKGSTVTYKGKSTINEGVKSRLEVETSVEDNFGVILNSLGYTPKLVYEKIRQEFNRADGRSALILLDELPFGYYMEIEGTVDTIKEAEKLLLSEGIDLSESVEIYSYPDLTQIYGKSVNGVTEVRF